MPTCNECEIKISSIRGLFAHLTIIHKYESTTQYQCIDCTQRRKFDCKNSFRKHLQKDHNFALAHHSEIENTGVTNAAVRNERSEFMDAGDNIGPEQIRDIPLTPSDFSICLGAQAETFVAKLYSNPRLPRNLVQKFIDDIDSFLGSGFLHILKTIVMQKMIDAHCNSDYISDIKTMFERLESPFEHLKTEYFRFKHFQSSGDYIPPESYVIGQKFCAKKSNRSVVGKTVDVCGQFVPLRRTLKRFFELPSALSDTLTYIESLKSEPNVVQNFIQTPLWSMKRHRYEETDIVLPLFIFFDDVEMNNPLGSRCCKVGAVYASIPCLPPECRSALKNFFLVLLFESEFRKEYGNKNTFSPLIEELTFLEQQGVHVNCPNGAQQVFFVTGLLLGDNLGLNGMLGMVESFTATHFCRFCKITKKDSESCTFERPELLRDPINYDEDVLVSNPAQTGIKELCVFNEIPSFHMTQNYSVDEMHDNREGVCHRSMLLILNGLTSGTYKSFDLDTLNSRLLLFDYGPIDCRNKPPCISVDSLKSTKLKMTAAESTCFVKLFGVIIGDLVSESNVFWKLYVSLREILDLTYAKRLPKNASPLLRVLIQEHLELYVELAGATLKPKHHFLTHYPRIFDESGPLVNLSSIRYEAKHRDLTQAAGPNMSRVNIAYSLAVKHQLNMCYRFKSNEKVSPNTLVGPGQVIVLNEDLPYFESLRSSMKERTDTYSPNWVEFKGSIFKPGMVVIVGADDLCPTLAEIKLIFIAEDDCPIFVCTYFANLGLSKHVWGYHVEATDEYISVKSTDLLDPLPISSYTMANGEKYVIFRYSI